jgi:hypothetical protein
MGTNRVKGAFFHPDTLAPAGQLIYRELDTKAIRTAQGQKNNTALLSRRPKATFM